MDTAGSGNDGFMQRYELTKKSAKFDMLGHLHCDIFNQDKFLIQGVELRLKLIPAKSSFCLISEDAGTEAKVNILDASLQVKKVIISPSVKLAHNKLLQTTTAKYPINRVQIKTFVISKDLQSKTFDNVFLGPLPNRVIVGFTNNDAFNGTITTNPFHLKHFDINFLTLYVDGKPVPAKPLQPDFDNRLYISSYQTLFCGSGIHFANNGNQISR